MMAFDIGSDIATGVDFVNSGDYGWATFTFLIICTPWLARSFLSLINLQIPGSAQVVSGTYAFISKCQVSLKLLS